MADAGRRPALRLAAACAAGLALAVAPAGRAAATPNGAPEAALARTWDGRTLDVLPLLAEGAGGPELKLAQRSIPRDIGKKTDTVGPEPDYAVIDVPGWKSPGQAGAMSLVVPGTGQLYAGSGRGYVFLGVEAVAAYAYVKYKGDSNDKQDEYFSYVGDPYQSASRFSFSRLSGTIPPAELSRLQEIYAKDPREFYDQVSTNDRYVSGWSDVSGSSSGQRSAAQDYIDQVERFGRKSRVGLFTMIANHLVSAADALHLTRMNNLALRQNMSLKINVRPGAHQSYGLTLTQKF